MEVKGLFIEETEYGYEGTINVAALQNFLLSLKNSPKVISVKMFQFAQPRPGHSHGFKLKRESIALLQ